MRVAICSMQKLSIMAEQNNNVLLAIENLRVRFRSHGALNAALHGNTDPFVDAVIDASLEVERGKTFGLVGAVNGQCAGD